MQTRALVSSQNARLQALRSKHAAIQDQLHEEQKHPAATDDLIRRLKLEKLKIKDEIEEEIRRA